MLKTIIVSDIHIGTYNSQHKKLLKFLEDHPCENLIINGDLIDELHIKFFGKWKEEYTETIEKIKSICKKNNTNIFYLYGNHEISAKDIPAVKDLHIEKDMIYVSHGKKYYICHGHQFDPVNHRLRHISYISFFLGSFINFINKIYNILRSKLWLQSHSLIQPIHRIGKSLIGGKRKLYDKLYAEATKRGCNGIICGHFHDTENLRLGEIHYLNTGERLDTCSAIIEDQAGNRDILYQK